MPAKKKKGAMLSWMHWLFLLGLVLSLAGAIVTTWTWVSYVLLVLGLIIGLGQLFIVFDAVTYFVGALVYVLFVLFVVPSLGLYEVITRFLTGVIYLVVPGALLVALKTFWESY